MTVFSRRALHINAKCQRNVMNLRSTVWPEKVGNQIKHVVWIPTFLLLIILGGCDGFFVDPTLTGIVVAPPTPSILENTTLQMTAAGTYDDGSTKTITGSAQWSTSDTSIVKISSSGVVTGLAPGTASISASSGTVSGSTTVVVTIAGLASIKVTPTSASISSGQTQQFQAMGLLQNGDQQDITDSVTWKSSELLVATIDANGLATAKTVTSTSTSNITATSGSIVSNTVHLGVTP
jgi:trimeric autotransporter adhesin